MTKNELAAKKAAKWAEKIGTKVAIARLLGRGTAVSTADKICNGRYESSPSDMLTAVLVEEMAKDGIVLDDKAS